MTLERLAFSFGTLSSDISSVESRFFFSHRIDMAHLYGYQPDLPKGPGEKPDRNFSLELSPRLTTLVAGDVDLRPFCTVQDQYEIGSCAGNATADSVEILNAIQGLPAVQLSRLFVYSMARNLEGTFPRDDGTHLRACFQILSTLGICREDLAAGAGGWPYDTAKAGVLPDLMAMRAATGHRIHSYYRITEEGGARIEAMKAALRANHPVVFGTQIDRKFQAISDLTPWKTPTKDILGGHAMVVVGWMQGLGFLVKNSWGLNWGTDGFCAMAEEVFDWELTQDLWVPTLGMSFKV